MYFDNLYKYFLNIPVLDKSYKSKYFKQNDIVLVIALGECIVNECDMQKCFVNNVSSCDINEGISKQMAY